jgi:hypothetical protein
VESGGERGKELLEHRGDRRAMSLKELLQRSSPRRHENICRCSKLGRHSRNGHRRMGKGVVLLAYCIDWKDAAFRKPIGFSEKTNQFSENQQVFEKTK